MHGPKRVIRLPEFDYSQGGTFFVTVCVAQNLWNRNVFGQIDQRGMVLNQFGLLVWECLEALPNHHPNVVLDMAVVMPNHIHMLLIMSGREKEMLSPREFGGLSVGSLSVLVGGLKGEVTRRVSRQRGRKTKVWQERFYDRVVRDEREFFAIRTYIDQNPARWLEDKFHPQYSGSVENWP